MSDSSDSVKSARSDNVTKRCKSLKQKMQSQSDTEGKVHIKIPQFYPDEPERWFAQVEGQFVGANVRDDTTKFYFVTGHLEPQYYAKEVKDIITSPPATNKLETPKEELIKRLSASKERKIQQLLMHEELGSRKPPNKVRKK